MRFVAGIANPEPGVADPFTRPCGVVEVGAGPEAAESLVDDAR